ncbi:MAG: hypothetical protein FD180_4547 [Planctomycetota bacterium]|nr:MAG: hypothetical protein FD180_4547 [Planctomycetota bacterium]
MTFEQDLAAMFNSLKPIRKLPPLPGLVNIATPTAMPGQPSPDFAVPDSGLQAPIGIHQLPAVAQAQNFPLFFGPAHVNALSPEVQVVRESSWIHPANGLPPDVVVLTGTDLPRLPGTVPPIGETVSMTGSAWPGPPGLGIAVLGGEPEKKVRFPWPCGRDMTKSEFDLRRTGAAGIIAAQVPLLDDHGPWASSEACRQIIETIRVNPKDATTALKDASDRLPKGSGLRKKIDKLLNCGRTLVDFLPFINGMSTEFNELGVITEPGQQTDVCEAAKANLFIQNRKNPAKMGAILAAIANDIDPTTSQSESFKIELGAIAADLVTLAGAPFLFGKDEFSDRLSSRILNLYGSLINASFCECPAPGADPAH